MSILKSSILSVSAIALLTGCGTSINLAKYKPATLDKAKHMPSKEKMMSKELPKVIVMDIDNNNIQVASQAKLGKSISTKINSGLAEGKSVKLVKRVASSNYEKMLAKEIEAAELAKELGSDVGQADFIVTGQLSNASYDYNFREGYYYYVKTKRGRIRKYMPPAINYKACSVGNLKVLTLPALEEATSIQFDECSSTSHQARSPKEAKTRNDGLVRQSGDESADTAKYPLKNFFARKGYVYEMRKDGDDTILKVTLGSQFGAKEGEDVEIFAVKDNHNSLTGETKKETVKIGEGTISNQVTKDAAWIIVDEIEEGNKVNAGDFVKIKYEESFWSKGLKALR